MSIITAAQRLEARLTAIERRLDGQAATDEALEKAIDHNRDRVKRSEYRTNTLEDLREVSAKDIDYHAGHIIAIKERLDTLEAMPATKVVFTRGKPTPEPEANPWIEHDGEYPKCKRADKVEVTYRDGDTDKHLSSDFRWYHCSADSSLRTCDIIKYRVVQS